MMHRTRYAIAMFGLAFACSGCLAGSLASSTGPRPANVAWSDAPRQRAHVGETVRFDFVLHDGFGNFIPAAGWADYGVITIGQEKLHVEPDPRGRFRFYYRFDDRQPGERIVVRAVAMRQREHRDFMKVGGRWLPNEDPLDRRDQPVAADAITLTLYQAAIALSLPRVFETLDPESGVLRIRRDNGDTTCVYLDRPDRRGFLIRGPTPEGVYSIEYPADGEDLNPSGETVVEFAINDVLGRTYRTGTNLKTP